MHPARATSDAPHLLVRGINSAKPWVQLELAGNICRLPRARGFWLVGIVSRFPATGGDDQRKRVLGAGSQRPRVNGDYLPHPLTRGLETAFSSILITPRTYSVSGPLCLPRPSHAVSAYSSQKPPMMAFEPAAARMAGIAAVLAAGTGGWPGGAAAAL